MDERHKDKGNQGVNVKDEILLEKKSTEMDNSETEVEASICAEDETFPL